MSRNPFGWDLPPGVTEKMIDDSFGPDCCPDPDNECTDCNGDGCDNCEDGHVCVEVVEPDDDAGYDDWREKRDLAREEQPDFESVTQTPSAHWRDEENF